MHCGSALHQCGPRIREPAHSDVQAIFPPKIASLGSAFECGALLARMRDTQTRENEPAGRRRRAAPLCAGATVPCGCVVPLVFSQRERVAKKGPTAAASSMRGWRAKCKTVPIGATTRRRPNGLNMRYKNEETRPHDWTAPVSCRLRARLKFLDSRAELS